MRWAPRQNADAGAVRHQKQVGAFHRLKSGDGGGVEQNAVLKRLFQLRGKNRDVFGRAEQVAERKADEFYIIFLHKAEDFGLGFGQHSLVSLQHEV